jgi:hypothetical protein
MTPESAKLLPLVETVQAMSQAASAPEVFKIMVQGARALAPRAAVFLIRQSTVQGWGNAGYASSTSEAQRSYRAPLDPGWLGQLARADGPGVHLRAPGAPDPDFGQPAQAEAAGVAVRVKDKPIAVIVAERDPGETPWFPEALAMFATVAQLRLELDLVRRKGGPSPAPAPALAREPQHAAVVESAVVAPEPESAPADSRLEAARRYARLVATDIRLYNEEAVMLGRRNGDLLDRLSDHLERGKETFLRRHGNLGPAGLAVLQEAYVQVLAGGDPQLLAAASSK